MAKWALNKRINLKVVALCFGIATTFWFFQAMNRDYDSEVSYDLRLVYDPDQFVAVGEPSEKININVRGYGWSLFFKKLGFGKEPIELNMSSLEAADYVKGSQLTGMISEQVEDCKVNFIASDTVFIRLDHSTERELHLRISNENLQEGVVMNTVPEIVPNIVHVRGPERVLQEIPDPFRIEIPKLNEGHSLRDYKFKINEVLPSNVVSQESKIVINVEAANYQEKRLTVPVEPVGFPYANVELEDVQIVCKTDIHQSLAPAQIHVVADYKTYRPGDKTVRLRVVDRPSFVKNIKVVPSRISVELDD